MSEEAGRRLGELLPGRLSKLGETMHQELGSDPSLAGHSPVWGFLASQASDALHAKLDVDLIDVLAGAWCKVRELREYTDPTKHPPTERSTVTLGTHRFTRTLHPVVRCRVAGQTLLKLPLNLDVTAVIETVSLGIQNGHIVAVGGGSGRVSAQLKYGDKALHDELKSRAVKFYEPISLKAPGLRIG
ncbi:MAG: hypothetical protein OEV90_03585 [Gammaproteobacteria bacterium]|nr:hypothetical protein [Gammaproteobacteria bacterium]MDH4312187.1 hypothetical protein [Gammaproteobacteria bacterium]